MTSLQNGYPGERKYHNTKAAYALPNDNPEHDRLESQANCIRELMNDQIIHAPLSASNLHKALDIGCGTGIVTHTIASTFPRAQVYGLDLSPVPNVRDKLPNIEYVQANINEVAGPEEPDARFQQGSFDYIFSRLLVLGMTDWKGYIDSCVALTRSGGWVEMHDIDWTLHQIPSPLTPSDRAVLPPHSVTLSDLQAKSHPVDAMVVSDNNWITTLRRLCAIKSLDATCGQHIPRMFAEAGLHDVKIKRYMYPMGIWEGMSEPERKFSQHNRNGIVTTMPQLFERLDQGQHEVSEVDVHKAIEECRKVRDGWHHNHEFMLLYAVCGRKP